MENETFITYSDLKAGDSFTFPDMLDRKFLFIEIRHINIISLDAETGIKWTWNIYCESNKKIILNNGKKR